MYSLLSLRYAISFFSGSRCTDFCGISSSIVLRIAILVELFIQELPFKMSSTNNNNLGFANNQGSATRHATPTISANQACCHHVTPEDGSSHMMHEPSCPQYILLSQINGSHPPRPKSNPFPFPAHTTNISGNRRDQPHLAPRFPKPRPSQHPRSQ